MRILAALMCQNELLDLQKNVTALLPRVDSITIVDGGSIDGSINFFRNWSKEDPRIRYFIHPWKDNFPEQRNNYLRRVREIVEPGDWIFACDPDETLEQDALDALRSLAMKGDEYGYGQIGFRCHSVSLRGNKEVHRSNDDHFKHFLIKYTPDLRYTHFGEGPVHEHLEGLAGPAANTGRSPGLPTEYWYIHSKQENCIWNRGVRNYFCGGGGPNLGSSNFRWLEMKVIAARLSIDSWHKMYTTLLAGNLDAELKAWIIKYRHESGWDGCSEQKEWYKTYFRLFHPEEEPEELRGEVIE